MPVSHFQLPNGLDVVLAPDDRVPKVVVNLAYKVGSLNEPPGRSGFAHLFEHLMFSGTPANPSIDATYAALGIDLNAWTWEDRTIYHAEGLSSALPVMLSVEADRMANQGASITQAHLDLQRSVVINEMRETVLDTVNAAGWEALRAALFPPGHPYSRSVIGSIADLEAARIEDVRAFFDTYYAPNNAILVLAGDFDRRDARRLITSSFGRIQRGARVARPKPRRVVPTVKRLAFEDRTPTPSVVFAWSAPGFASMELGSLRIAAELLGNADYGILRLALVDTGLATAVHSWLERGFLGSRFFIDVALAQGVDPANVRRVLRRALAGFGKSPVAKPDLERARQRLLLNDRVSLELLRARAEHIAVATDMLDSPQAAFEDDTAVVAVTPAALRRAVASRLDPAKASIMVIRPGERGGYPRVLTAPTGVARPLAKARRKPVTVPQLGPRRPATGRTPIRKTATLSNGIAVTHYRLAHAPLSYLAASSSAGTLSAPEGREGIIELAAAMGTRGAAGLSLEAFGKAMRDLGADLDWKADDIGAFLTMHVPPENLGPAVALFADALRRPTFSAAEWRIAVAETIDELERREGDLPDVAARTAVAALFPKRAREPAIDRSVKSVRSIKRAEARELYARMFSPRAISFISVGPSALREVVAALEASFADWTSDAPPPPRVVRRPASFRLGRKILLVPEPGASQSALYVARPAPGIDEPGRAETMAVLRLLSLDFLSRLNTVIREEKGFSYGTDGELFDAVRRGSGLAVETAVERENTAAALLELFAGFETLKAEPVKDEEVERTVMAFRSYLAATGETAAGLFDEITTQIGRGSSLEEAHARRRQIASLDLRRVRRQARTMASLESAVVVVVGDPDVVRPQLEAAGLDPELVEREA